jgi:hypothetical protein
MIGKAKGVAGQGKPRVTAGEARGNYRQGNYRKGKET